MLLGEGDDAAAAFQRGGDAGRVLEVWNVVKQLGLPAGGAQRSQFTLQCVDVESLIVDRNSADLSSGGVKVVHRARPRRRFAKDDIAGIDEQVHDESKRLRRAVCNEDV